MKQTFIILLFFLFELQLSAQLVEITYDQSFKTFVGLGEIENPILQQKIKEDVENNLSKSQAFLLYENGKSIYKKKVIQKVYSADRNLKVTSSGRSNVFYKDLSNNHCLACKYILDKAFLVEDSISYNWELVNKKKKIGEYLCYKAVIGTAITAWYCSEIPICDGPGKYAGLPGLIVALETPDVVYHLSGLKVNNARKAELIPPTEGKKLSAQEFEKIKKEKLGNQKGIIIQVDEM